MTQGPPDIEPDVRPDLLRAIVAVVLELANILSDYLDAFVVSGGLALHLLFPPGGTQASHGTAATLEEEQEPFERLTKDVDLILNVPVLEEQVYNTLPAIGELLLQNNYQQEHKKFYWVKTVNLEGFMKPVTVPVEFLAPGRFANSPAEAAIIKRMSALQDVEAVPLGGIDLGSVNL